MAPLYPLIVAADQPLSWWRMNAPTGTTETDRGSLGHNGTYNGSPTLNQPGPVAGGAAVLFNKDNSQYLLTADDNGYSVGTTGSLTVEWWARFNAAAVAPANRLISKFNSTGGNREWTAERFANTQQCVFRLFAGVNTVLTENSFGFTLPLNVFHHFVVTAVSAGGTTTVRSYLDGGLTDTQTCSTASLVNCTSNVVIGGSDEGFYMSGLVAEAAIYSTALSAARVYEHWQTINMETTSTDMKAIFARHPASVLGTGNNPDLLINNPEAV